MNRHCQVLPIFFLCILAGCVPKPTQRQLIIHESSQADALMRSGQHQEAAKLYQTLASSKPHQSNQFNLLAAEAFIQSGDSQAAQTHVEAINPILLSTEQESKFNLILAQISLSNGEAEQALTKLSLTQAHILKPTDLITFYQSQAFAYSLTGNILQSIQARIQLSPLLNSPQQTQQNNRVILDTLNLVPAHTLSTQQIPPPNVLGGWISLSMLLKTSRLNQTPSEFQASLNQWRLSYPYHPANSDFLLSYLMGAKNNFVQASSIAVLLPQSGRYARAAAVIKKGFMAAYHQSNNAPQPAIRFYDSSSDTPVNLYHKAISEGAELIIGPLSKDRIQNLALTTELTTPVLALNHIQNLAKDNLFQFGLSPLDDTRGISKQAKQTGYAKVLLLTPNNKKGQRINNHLTETWQELGGTVLESQSFNSRGHDFSQPIKSLLNLDESQYRYKNLRRFLSRNIGFTERRRDDVDAIFLSASAQAARSIYPQLQFYRASRVPIFATPDLYTGLENPSLDIDLNNITFCDIPWLFPEAYSGELSQAALQELWQSEPNKYLRLVALGIDAYNIIKHLNQIADTPYHGATGVLSINMENRITRQLICAQFNQGKPVLQNFVQQETDQVIQDDLSYSDELIE